MSMGNSRLRDGDGTRSNKNSSPERHHGGGRTFLNNLHGRELGRSLNMRSIFTSGIEKRINKELNHVLEDCDALATAIRLGREDNVAIVVGDVLGHFLDHSVYRDESLAPISANDKAFKKKQQRELFMAMGGAESLLTLFLPPFAPVDAELISKPQMQEKSEMFNEVLVIIRELLSSVPAIADRLIDTKHLVFMFTLLRHQAVFDNTMSILEEVLASREDTLHLGVIPKLNSLVLRFSPRQLAHFCRVLSLVVFEPEDRSIMEGSQVLRSLELLQLRRNRMSRSCSGTVERNQNLILEMPHLVERLVQILRIINYGPGLSDLVSNNIVTHMPITSEVLEFYSSKYGINDWDHFSNLEFVVEREAHYREQDSLSDDVSIPNDNIHEELLRSFSPTMSNGNRSIEFGNIANVMNLANTLGIADYTPLGHAVLLAARSMAPGGSNNPLGLANEILASTSRSNRPSRADFSLERLSPIKAKKELQFHAMLLTPHQIELVFVICTLLSGRRKLAVQKALVDQKFGRVLLDMYDRMSWDAPPYTGINHLEHVHGPNCECNPEGAVRIQYLRLIHNFYDRDFLGNNSKFVVLSPEERKWILSSSATDIDDEESEGWRRWRDEATSTNMGTSLTTIHSPHGRGNRNGLVVKIIQTLNKEKSDSTYRFWLSACLENFLRGSGRMAQYFVVKSGALAPTVRHIISGCNDDNHSTMQTSFDLLGEIIKANKNILEYMESVLSNDEFREFMVVVMDNLVESNVFLRSLFLTLEVISASNATASDRTNVSADSFGFVHNAIIPEEDLYLGIHVPNENHKTTICRREKRFHYLSDSWIQFCPQPLHEDAIDLYDEKSGFFDDLQEKILTKIIEKQQVSIATNVGVTGNLQSTIANIGNGVIGAIKDIRKATTHFLKFGEGVSSSTTSKVGPPKSKINHESFSDEEVAEVRTESCDRNDEHQDERKSEDENYLTPREGEISSGNDEHRSNTEDASEKKSDVAPFNPIYIDFQQLPLALCNQIVAATLPPSSSTSSSHTKASNFAIPHSLFRFSVFILQEKLNILLRLMSIVSLRNVNHENICCLNTALMILLFDYTRGNLALTLNRLKQLADQEYANPSDPIRRGRRLYQNLRTNVSAITEEQFENKSRIHCCTDCCSGRTNEIDDQRPLCTVCTVTDNDESLTRNSSRGFPLLRNRKMSGSQTAALHTGSFIVMRNFRELLWYWQEYYLRRGRDRLSIEFSCHIPFKYWFELVGVLCADNGSSTALLQEPISLPQSPYTSNIPQSLQYSKCSNPGTVQNL